MSQKTNPAILGTFVVVAVVMMVALVVVFGSIDFMSQKATCVMYFDESVGGLDVGAPVEFQGVLVGNVTDVYMLSSEDDPIGQIPVVVRLQPKQTKRIGAKEKISMDAVMKMLVERGLRAKLTSQSMVTGKLKIVLDLVPGNEPIYRNKYLKYTEIPTMYSPIASLSRELKDMPFKDIVNNLNEAVESVAALTGSEDLEQVLAEANGTLAETKQVMASLKSNIPVMMGNMNQMMLMVQSILSENSSTRHDFSVMSAEVTDMARSVRYLADYIERHPESLLKGKNE